MYVVGLAFGRVRRRSSGALLAAVGIAIGTAVLIGVLAGTKIAQDRSVSQAVDRIPAASRSVRAVWFGVPVGSAQAYPALDATVRAKLEGIGLPGPTPIVLFRESTVAGHFVSLAGVKGLAPYVHLTSGRLPRSCTPTRCEVVLLRGTGTLPSAPGLRLVKVGTGTLRSSQLFGDFLAPTDNALEDRELAPALQQGASYHRPLPAPLVVAEGIETLTRAPATANTYRSYAWMWPLAAGRPRLWEIDGLVSRSERARAALSGDSIGYSVQAPVEELRATEASATVAGRRLLLVGGEAAALLFAFAVLAARSMRRDLEAARRRLTWYGARRWQLRLLTVTESAIVAVAGAVIGWLVGVVVGGLAASRAGAPVGAVLRESVLSPAGLAVAAGVVVLATLVVAVATAMPARDENRLGLLDLAAAGSIALVLAALRGGAADESRLASSQNAGLVLLLLPGLIAFAAAVAAARLFGPLVRLAGRLLHRSVGNAEGVSGITVLGLPAAETKQLHGWRSDFSGDSRASLAAAMTPPADAAVKGIPLGSRLRFDAGPGVVAVRATIATPDGRYTFVELGSLADDAPTQFDRTLPARLRGGKLVALELVPPRLVDRGADAGRPLAGTLRLGGLAAQGWLGEGGVVLRPDGDGVELTYRINQQNDARIRARQTTDTSPPAVLVTPKLAALVGGVGGTLGLEIGGRRVPVRVAAVVDHFPGTSGQAVIGDVTSLATAVNAQVPGAGETNEVWLDVPSGSTDAAMAALAQPPFRGLESLSRSELLDEARDDPLGHGTLLALDSAAVVALLLAALGLALTVLSDLRDDRGDLYDLESQGAEPRLLRRIVRVRALVVGIAGVLAGAAAGALLALLVTRVVSVTARATTSDLPMQTSFDLRVLVVAALAYLLLAAALVALATRRAFRDDRGPVRAQEAGT